ncbi:MAG: hypothetical protein AB8G11_02675 [Saprospiraceae bacterium]
MQRLVFILFTIILFSACNNGQVKTVEFDLIKYGISLTVNAPENAVITQPSDGSEVWIVDSTSNFEIQVKKALSLTNDVIKVKNEELELVKTTTGFSKIIKEEDNGFIFEENFNETSYDFRYFVVQGDNKFIFQKIFTSNPSLEEIEKVFEIVSK